jgi:hypothetical protein
MAKLDAKPTAERPRKEETRAEEPHRFGVPEDEAEKTATGPSLSRVKPGTPPDFDGSRDRGRAFLNILALYFIISGDAFPTDQARIHWALSFFRTGRAARFANLVLRAEAKFQVPRFRTWADFEREFVDQFCPRNEQLTALTKLEVTSWHQAKDPIDDYIDRFQELIDLAEYDDDKMKVIKFCRGLDPSLQNKVALLGWCPGI